MDDYCKCTCPTDAQARESLQDSVEVTIGRYMHGLWGHDEVPCRACAYTYALMRDLGYEVSA